jgi:hypothetical protein
MLSISPKTYWDLYLSETS